LEAERLRLEVAAATARERPTEPEVVHEPVPEIAQVSEEQTSPHVASADGPGTEHSTVEAPAVGATARAFVESATLRRAARALLALHRGTPDGAALGGLVSKALAALEGSGTVASCDSVVTGDEAMRSAWEAAGLSATEAEQALCEAVKLLAPRGSVTRELKRAGEGDRAAVLQLMVFDQLPDQYGSYADLVMMEDDKSIGSEDLVMVDQSLTKKLGTKEKEAARFARRLEGLPSDDARARSRLQRLREEPMMKEVAALVAADSELTELAGALAPWELQLYQAARKAQLRARPKEDQPEEGTEIIKLEFTIVQLVGSLVVTIALAYFSAQAVKQAVFPNKDLSTQAGDMPLYSLKSDAARPFNGDQRSLDGDLPMYGLRR